MDVEGARRARMAGLLIGAAWVALFVLSLALGAVHLPAEAWSSCLLGDGDGLGTACVVVRELRLPRALLATGVGAGLAVAGVLLQAALRSTLADPYILGVSSGAMCGAALVTTLGLGAAAGGSALALGACLGAAVSALLAVAIARVSGAVSPGRLLLVGAALSSLAASLTGLLLTLAPEASQVRSLVLWLLGGLGAASWGGAAWTGGVAGAGLVAALAGARGLDLLLLGEAPARALGLDTSRFRTGVVLASAVLTGAAVAFAGAIGFVGLAVPHAARWLFGASHRALVPGAAILGAAVVVALDLAARLVIAPEEVPIGVLAGVLGAPFFLLLLRADARREAEGWVGDA